MEKQSIKMAETMLDSITWKVQDAHDDLERARRKIEREINNFGSALSADCIQAYAREIKEARDVLAIYVPLQKKLQNLLSTIKIEWKYEERKKA